jgi:hypothetical protein
MTCPSVAFSRQRYSPLGLLSSSIKDQVAGDASDVLRESQVQTAVAWVQPA